MSALRWRRLTSEQFSFLGRRLYLMLKYSFATGIEGVRGLLLTMDSVILKIGYKFKKSRKLTLNFYYYCIPFET